MRRFAVLVAIAVTSCATADGDDGLHPGDAAKLDSNGDVAPHDTIVVDGGLEAEAPGTDTGADSAADSSLTDTGLADTGLADTGLADTGLADTGSVDTGPADTSGCTTSPVGTCASGVVVVGHYSGGSKTVDVAPGATAFKLALLSYDKTSWTLSGAVARVSRIEIFSYTAGTTIAGNAGIPTTIQTGPTGTCSPYTYATTMGECAAHTGWAGCKFAVAATAVCNAELGLSGACAYPTFTCLRISP